MLHSHCETFLGFALERETSTDNCRGLGGWAKKHSHCETILRFALERETNIDQGWGLGGWARKAFPL